MDMDMDMDMDMCMSMDMDRDRGSTGCAAERGDCLRGGRCERSSCSRGGRLQGEGRRACGEGAWLECTAGGAAGTCEDQRVCGYFGSGVV